jgi:hypothetical protein
VTSSAWLHGCAASLLSCFSLAGIVGCEAVAQQQPGLEPHQTERNLERSSTLVSTAERRAIQTRMTLRAQGVVRNGSGQVLSARCAEREEELFEAGAPVACDELHIESLGTTYRAFLFSKAHDVLVIVHEGHLPCVASTRLVDTIQLDALALIHRLIERADVLYLDMPMLGTNCGQTFEMKGIKYSGYMHNWLALVDEPGQSGLAYFFNHISLALDYLGGRYEAIDMTGRSGGGWATTVYSALDWRVDRSVVVAGSLPIELRTPESDGADDIGDWEQYAAHVWKLVSYQELYEAAGGLDESRRHVQIYNEFDRCCFKGAKGMAAATDYSSSAKEYLQGRVTFLVNHGEREHVFPVEMVIEQLFGG